LWEVASGTLVSAWNVDVAEPRRITCIALDERADYAFLGTSSGSVLRMPVMPPLPEDVLRLNGASITSLALLRERAAVGTSTGDVWIWPSDAASARRVATVGQGPISAIAWVDREFLCVATELGQVRLLEAINGATIWDRMGPDHVKGLEACATPASIAVWSEARLDVLDASTGSTLGALRLPSERPPRKQVTQVFVDPASHAGVFCVPGGFELANDVMLSHEERSGRDIRVHAARFRGGAPEFLTYRLGSRGVYYWTHDGDETRLLDSGRFVSPAVSFGPGPDACVLGCDVINHYDGRQGDTELWDLRRGERLRTCFAHPGAHGPRILAVHDETRSVFSANANELVRIDAATGNVSRLATLGQAKISAMCVSSDGEHLAYGCEDGTLTVVGVADGVRTPLVGHYGKVIGLQFLSGGNDDCLVSASLDRTVRCWSLRVQTCADALQLNGIPVSLFVLAAGQVGIAFTSGDVVMFEFVSRTSLLPT
jgi:hypothetical protein